MVEGKKKVNKSLKSPKNAPFKTKMFNNILKVIYICFEHIKINTLQVVSLNMWTYCAEACWE